VPRTGRSLGLQGYLMFAVFDLDGTLMMCEHRRHHLAGPKPNFHKFNSACVDDEPCAPLVALISSLQTTGWRVELWSAREDRYLAHTMVWLSMNEVWVGREQLRMRPAGDYRPDEVLKEEWLLSLSVRPDIVFDDRRKVVDMWRRNGITCAQMAPGEF